MLSTWQVICHGGSGGLRVILHKHFNIQWLPVDCVLFIAYIVKISSLITYFTYLSSRPTHGTITRISSDIVWPLHQLFFGKGSHYCSHYDSVQPESAQQQ